LAPAGHNRASKLAACGRKMPKSETIAASCDNTFAARQKKV
jgi:hypothetical protein